MVSASSTLATVIMPTVVWPVAWMFSAFPCKMANDATVMAGGVECRTFFSASIVGVRPSTESTICVCSLCGWAFLVSVSLVVASYISTVVAVPSGLVIVVSLGTLSPSGG